MKVAIIGAGISGLTTAYLLCPRHEVTVYESANYLGGHTATADIEIGGKQLSVDTGFIVFNDWTYPHFMKLLHSLNVHYQCSEMGFSVTTRNSEQGNFEYCGSNLNAIFSQRSNILNPRFYRMLKEIIAFNKQCKLDLDQNLIPADLSLQDYLNQFNFGDLFLHRYITPMASAIWSSSTTDVGGFNARNFVKFFLNHGLLNLFNRPQWSVITGGSRNYIEPLTRSFKDRIRIGDGVRSVKRTKEDVVITSELGKESYDQVVMACHSNQALNLVSEPCETEIEVLLGIPYRENSVLLHTDDSVLPKNKRAWASWNYLIDGNESTRPVLTYNMNKLQKIKCCKTICVSVNADDHIAEQKVLRRFKYAHPQFGKHSIRSQSSWHLINGKKRTWYCGAYWGNGFHEDGVISATRVSNALGGATL